MNPLSAIGVQGKKPPLPSFKVNLSSSMKHTMRCLNDALMSCDTTYHRAGEKETSQ